MARKAKAQAGLAHSKEENVSRKPSFPFTNRSRAEQEPRHHKGCVQINR